MEEKSQFAAKDRILFLIVSFLGPALIWLLGKTWSITLVGQENVDQIKGHERKVCYASWHGRLLALAHTYRHQGIRILISLHRDGEFIARIVQKLGFVPIRGSSTRGGAKAILEMVKASQKHDIALTPDGPKGPRHRVQPGAAYLSSRAVVPLVPVTNSASSFWRLNTWDQFLIPKPFSKVVVCIGEAIWVRQGSSSTELENVSQKLEDRLLALTEEADHYFSRT